MVLAAAERAEDALIQRLLRREPDGPGQASEGLPREVLHDGTDRRAHDLPHDLGRRSLSADEIDADMFPGIVLMRRKQFHPAPRDIRLADAGRIAVPERLQMAPEHVPHRAIE